MILTVVASIPTTDPGPLLACTPYALAYTIRLVGPEAPRPIDVAASDPLPSRA